MCTIQGQRGEGTEATGRVLRLQSPVPPASPQIFHDSRPMSLCQQQKLPCSYLHTACLPIPGTIPKLPVRDSEFILKLLLKLKYYLLCFFLRLLLTCALRVSLLGFSDNCWSCFYFLLEYSQFTLCWFQVYSRVIQLFCSYFYKSLFLSS